MVGLIVIAAEREGMTTDGATVALCLDGNCRPVEVIEVPDGSGDRLILLPLESGPEIAVRLEITEPGPGGQRSISGKGTVRTGRCTCPGLAFRLDDGRLKVVR